jgi:hypothetical protein
MLKMMPRQRREQAAEAMCTPAILEGKEEGTWRR